MEWVARVRSAKSTPRRAPRAREAPHRSLGEVRRRRVTLQDSPVHEPSPLSAETSQYLSTPARTQALSTNSQLLLICSHQLVSSSLAQEIDGARSPFLYTLAASTNFHAILSADSRSFALRWTMMVLDGEVPGGGWGQRAGGGVKEG